MRNQCRKNGKIIEEPTDVANYGAHADQVKELCSKLFKRNYYVMRERIKK